MRALKILVVVMGIMLVIGFAALLVAIAAKVSHRRPQAAAADHPFPTTAVEIPRGARVEAMTTAPDRLILDLVLPDGGREIVLIDLATGARLGTIELRPQK